MLFAIGSGATTTSQGFSAFNSSGNLIIIINNSSGQTITVILTKTKTKIA